MEYPRVAFGQSYASRGIHKNTARANHFSLLRDRKSTRLNSSHPSISYAVFCLKKKNITDLSHPHPALLVPASRLLRLTYAVTPPSHPLQVPDSMSTVPHVPTSDSITVIALVR